MINLFWQMSFPGVYLDEAMSGRDNKYSTGFSMGINYGQNITIAQLYWTKDNLYFAGSA